MKETITLFALSDFPWDDETKNTIVSSMIEAGYRPINGVPKSSREKQPYLTLHFIARYDVPNHQ